MAEKTLTQQSEEQHQILSKYLPQTISPTISPTIPQADTTAMINQQAVAQKAAQAAQLQAARDKAVSGYNEKIAGLDQNYRPLKDQQDFQYNKGVQATNERLANMGIYNSGDMVTAQVGNNATNQNALNSLNQSQLKDKTNFENLIAQANNDYNTNLASAAAGIDAQALQSLISQANADRTFNYNAGQDSFNNNINAANLTGMYNGQQTMQGQQSAANLIGQNLSNQSQATQNQYLGQQLQGQVTGQNLSNQTAQTNLQYLPQQLQAALQGQNLQNQTASTNLQYLPQQLQGQITGQDLSNQTAQTNLQYLPQQLQASLQGQALQNQNQAIVNQYLPQQLQAQLTGTNLQNDYQVLVNNGYPAQQAAQLAQAYANIRQGDAQIEISRQNANNSASNAAAQLAWAKDPTNPDNAYKQAQIAAASEKSAGTPTYKETLNNAQKLLATDSYGNRQYSNDQIINYVKYSSLSPEEKVQVLQQLGMPSD